jgi:hypothetical protein
VLGTAEHGDHARGLLKEELEAVCPDLGGGPQRCGWLTVHCVH